MNPWTEDDDRALTRYVDQMSRTFFVPPDGGAQLSKEIGQLQETIDDLGAQIRDLEAERNLLACGRDHLQRMYTRAAMAELAERQAMHEASRDLEVLRGRYRSLARFSVVLGGFAAVLLIALVWGWAR